MMRDMPLDAVFVLVQPDVLFRVASDSLLAGKHVFMEKPMGITLFQANPCGDWPQGMPVRFMLAITEDISPCRGNHPQDAGTDEHQPYRRTIL